jgi:hypothetical protein
VAFAAAIPERSSPFVPDLADVKPELPVSLGPHDGGRRRDGAMLRLGDFERVHRFFALARGGGAFLGKGEGRGVGMV